jgi:hypothetical protein
MMMKGTCSLPWKGKEKKKKKTNSTSTLVDWYTTYIRETLRGSFYWPKIAPAIKLGTFKEERKKRETNRRSKSIKTKAISIILTLIIKNKVCLPRRKMQNK